MKRKSAVFTICKNEEVFLPMWLKYYRQHFNDEDIYILDHQSDDGSTDNLPSMINHIIVKQDLAFDHNWVTNTVKSKQQELLGQYDVVLFTEIDEIIWAEEGLRNYIE